MVIYSDYNRHFINLVLYLFVWFLFIPLPSHAIPDDDNITFHIVEKDGTGLPFATIYVENNDRTYTADARGNIALKRTFFQGKGSKVTVSYVGKETKTLRISAASLGTRASMTIPLEDNSLYLKEVQVNAVRSTKNSNSSMVIQRNTIDNIQAYSLADIMQVLPGKAILNTDMHNASFLTLRSVLSGSVENPLDAYTRNKINDYTRNAAFGISYVVDGTPISNNTNMQLDSYGKWGGTKMFDRRFNTDNNENVGNGNDLRLIPASSIESIEVISGVAPVKYGDLSSGAVIINRRAGLTPFYGSVKVQYDIFNASIGKGISLGDKYGLLNFNIDYVSSTRDRRDKLKTNSNIALNTTWTKMFSRKQKWENTLSLDLTRSLDGLKNDPDAVLNRTKTEQSALRLSTRGSLSPVKSVFDMLEYNLSFSLSRQYDMHEEFIANTRRSIITDAYTSGLHETDIAPPYYTALLEIEGMPLATYGNVEGHRLLKFGKTSHNFTLGIFGRYEANLGKGKIFNAETPYYDGGQDGRGDRSYDYKNRVRLLQYGGYVQDKMTLPLAENMLSVTGGLRFETQRRYFTASPRLNAIFALNNGLSFYAAYGISYKIPATAYLYPENVYFDRLVFSHYSDNANERLYLYQTKVVDPTNKNLKSPYTHSFELGLSLQKRDFTTSLTGYMKIDMRGISSRSVIDTMWVQNYKKTGVEPSGKPIYGPDGERELIVDSYYTPENSLYSRSMGVEWIGNIRNIRPLGIALNYSVVYNYSLYHSKGERAGGNIDMQKEAVTGLYAPTKNSSDEVISTLSITKHIPVIGLIFNLRLQNFWYRHYNRHGFNVYPIGYYDRNFKKVYFEGKEAEDPKWGYLRLTDTEPVNINQPIIVPNCHLRVSKELGQKLRLSCYVNNVFNYRPYIERYGTRIYFNQAPTISMDISYKL